MEVTCIILESGSIAVLFATENCVTMLGVPTVSGLAAEGLKSISPVVCRELHTVQFSSVAYSILFT